MSGPVMVLPDRLLTEESPLHLYRIHLATNRPDFFGRRCIYRFDATDKDEAHLFYPRVKSADQVRT